jgi:phosphoglucosamine mutase
MELLLKNNLILGGETSGHIINLELTTTGDGIITALQVLETIILTGKNLSDLTKEISKYPQIMRNIKFDTQIDITRNDEINLAIKDTENILGNTGRVVLRPSGTESLIRIMVEGENENQIETLVDELVDKVNKVTTRLH